MKLESIDTFVTAPPTGIGGAFWVFVRVTTDTGIEGVGECYGVPFGPNVVTAAAVDMFDRYIAGTDPHQLELMFRRAYSAGFTQRPDVTAMGVFSGIEMAVWDILGKAHGVPVYELLGGRLRDRLRAYTYLYPLDVDDRGQPLPGTPDVYHDPAAAADAAARYVDMGWTAVKQDPAGPYTIQGGRELSLTELRRCQDNAAAIRDAVGDRADILFGTHGQMTTSSAIRLARRLEAFDPLWFEEPCPPDQMAAIGEVAAATSIPVATGERLTTAIEFKAALDAGVRIVQPNVGRCGGIRELKRIAALTELYNAQVAPHIYCGPVAHAAAAHVGFTSPSFLILETIRTDFHDAVVDRPLEWDSGFVLAPTEPGLGLELNLDVLAAHPCTSTRGRHLEMTQRVLDSANELTVGDLD
ncbi:MAG: mandelate racemase/muconate lactonizing enzyme family protein [Acidimicrobiales bacterium]|nr:mandelate racemase/muconate lactonizing enzyme family protein [Acidimicrobiales bacterium]